MIGLGLVVVLLLAWVLGGRAFALALDRIHTVPVESQPITELGLEDVEIGVWRVNDLPLGTAAPDNRPYPMETKIDPERKIVVQSANHAILLGRARDSLGKTVRPEPRDKARFQIDRGMGWPTPLELNFMTGHSPSWRRHLYYRLIWEKPDGGRLEMVWRYEQPYYDGWASGFMTRAGTTGLIRVEIRP